MSNEQHPARRQRRGERPTEPLEFDEPAKSAEPAARIERAAAPAPTTPAVDFRKLLIEARAVLETWKDAVPAVSLCTDIDKALAAPPGTWPLCSDQEVRRVQRESYEAGRAAAPATASGDELPSIDTPVFDELIDDYASNFASDDRWQSSETKTERLSARAALVAHIDSKIEGSAATKPTTLPTREQIIEASGDVLLRGAKPGEIEYDEALVAELARRGWIAATKSAAPAVPSKITDLDSARAFLEKWHRKHFPTDRTFTRYITGEPYRDGHLSGDFAWQLAKALESMSAPMASDDAVIEAKPVKRDECGYWSHPDMPQFEEGESDKFRAWAKSQGLEITYRSLENEHDTDPAYIAYFEKGENTCAGWEPTEPRGEGWFVLAIDETEDGPQCWWVRRTKAAGAEGAE